MNKQKMTAKEIFSIPNLMGYFRILLIPVFSWIYIHADGVSDYYMAAVLVGISGLTDMFDGKVARKFNMITELGKFIDPLADKLTQGALVLCFAVRYPLMRAVLALFILKEGFMGIMGLLLLPRGKKLDGAMWFGKVCTAVLYVLLFILLLWVAWKAIGEYMAGAPIEWAGGLKNKTIRSVIADCFEIVKRHDEMILEHLKKGFLPA